MSISMTVLRIQQSRCQWLSSESSNFDKNMTVLRIQQSRYQWLSWQSRCCCFKNCLCSVDKWLILNGIFL
jgi:hypothetical protein